MCKLTILPFTLKVTGKAPYPLKFQKEKKKNLSLHQGIDPQPGSMQIECPPPGTSVGVAWRRPPQPARSAAPRRRRSARRPPCGAVWFPTAVGAGAASSASKGTPRPARAAPPRGGDVSRGGRAARGGRAGRCRPVCWSRSRPPRARATSVPGDENAVMSKRMAVWHHSRRTCC